MKRGRARKSLLPRLLNDENRRFTRKSSLAQAQFAPTNTIGITDINNDNIKDIILRGNLERIRARTGMYTANNGFVFIGSEKGTFICVDQTTSGLNVTGTVRKIFLYENKVLFGRNNTSIKVYELNH